MSENCNDNVCVDCVCHCCPAWQTVVLYVNSCNSVRLSCWIKRLLLLLLLLLTYFCLFYSVAGTSSLYRASEPLSTTASAKPFSASWVHLPRRSDGRRCGWHGFPANEASGAQASRSAKPKLRGPVHAVPRCAGNVETGIYYGPYPLQDGALSTVRGEWDVSLRKQVSVCARQGRAEVRCTSSQVQDGSV